MRSRKVPPRDTPGFSRIRQVSPNPAPRANQRQHGRPGTQGASVLLLGHCLQVSRPPLENRVGSGQAMQLGHLEKPGLEQANGGWVPWDGRGPQHSLEAGPERCLTGRNFLPA